MCESRIINTSKIGKMQFSKNNKNIRNDKNKICIYVFNNIRWREREKGRERKRGGREGERENAGY